MKHTISSSPALAHLFRQNTEKQKTMAGVASPSFKCKKCEKYKPVQGRRQAVKGSTKFGYLCADCASA